jgi:hypothetical protein
MRSQVRDLLHGPSSFCFSFFGLLAQLVEHFPVEDVVTGSTPVQAAIIYVVLPQLMERKINPMRRFDPDRDARNAQVAELEDAPASNTGLL